MAKLPYRGSWPRARLAILERDGYMCQIRGPRCKGVATEVDHIVELAAGGHRLLPSNLRAACRPCNAGRRMGHGLSSDPLLPSREW